MQIGEARQGDVIVLTPAGRIDTTTSGALETRLASALAGASPHLVVDLSAVDYISSAGLRVLLVAARRVQAAGGRLALCAMGQPVRQVFQLAGFLPLFTIQDTREAAVAGLAGPPPGLPPKPLPKQ
jgi:stage II sporulation protein AA (anti-sigma F factor antagonist)